MDSLMRTSVAVRVGETLLKFIEFGILVTLSLCLVKRAEPLPKELGITFLLYTVAVLVFLPLLWHWLIEESHNHEKGKANEKEKKSDTFACVVYLAMSGLLGTSGTVLVIIAHSDGLTFETEEGLFFSGFIAFLLHGIWKGYPVFWQNVFQLKKSSNSIP